MAGRRNQLSDVWKRVEHGDPDECWPFIGAVNTYGYGQIGVGGKQLLAHRVTYELTTGDVLGDRLGCHSCDNPRCCNPFHIFPGTVADNAEDASLKGRLLHGESHKQAKLKVTQVLEIWRLFADGQTFVSIARLFGVTPENVSYICHRRTWRHV